MCSHIPTFFGHYYFFLFLPFCNCSWECVFRAKLLWPNLLTQNVYPYSHWEIRKYIVWVARGRWVSQWAEMSTKTYASPNRIQTIKAVSHHYCHCRRKNSFVFCDELSKFDLFGKIKRGQFYWNAGWRKKLEDVELLLILLSLETSPPIASVAAHIEFSLIIRRWQRELKPRLCPQAIIWPHRLGDAPQRCSGAFGSHFPAAIWAACFFLFKLIRQWNVICCLIVFFFFLNNWVACLLSLPPEKLCLSTE